MGIMTKQYDIKWQIGLWLVILSIGILTPTAVTADEALNDSVKRHRVKAMYASYKKSFPEVVDISAECALLKLKKGSKIIFVDVRKSSEQAISMLPGAITDREFLKN
jgi:sodium/bile acid cotransporter 7